jgi:hypothetical protein
MNIGDGENVESTLIEPTRPEDNKAALLVSEFESLNSFDFYNFNYFSFEQDIADMQASEFEWWYEGIFEPWLIDLDNNFLDINFEDIKTRFNTPEEKRIFLLKIVNFVMFLLPYQILKNVFQKYELSDIYDIQKFLKEDLNLINLRNVVIENIDHNMIQFDSFVKTLLHFEKVAKKNLIEENIELLDDHIKKQNLFLEIFKSIIEETDMHKFSNLIKTMLENDARNIL